MVKPALNLADLSVDEKLELIDDLWTSIDFSGLPLAVVRENPFSLKSLAISDGARIAGLHC